MPKLNPEDAKHAASLLDKFANLQTLRADVVARPHIVDMTIQGTYQKDAMSDAIAARLNEIALEIIDAKIEKTLEQLEGLGVKLKG